MVCLEQEEGGVGILDGVMRSCLDVAAQQVRCQEAQAQLALPLEMEQLHCVQHLLSMEGSLKGRVTRCLSNGTPIEAAGTEVFRLRRGTQVHAHVCVTYVLLTRPLWCAQAAHSCNIPSGAGPHSTNPIAASQ